MQYICRLSGTWVICDDTGSTRSSKLLSPVQAETIGQLFAACLHQTAILDVLSVSSVSPRKLQLVSTVRQAATYYLCKFSGSWSILDTATGTNTPLAPTVVEIIKELFPSISTDSAILSASMVTPFPAAKLQAPVGQSAKTQSPVRATA